MKKKRTKKNKKNELDWMSKKEVMRLAGMLLIGFAFIDFIASYAGTNLTPFLGDLSAFSPIIFGLIGAALMKS